jgi:hypothetical protein
MTMPVSDHLVATLRAFLEGNKARYNDLLAQTDQQVDGLGYSALITAAFFEAVDRRFAKQATRADVVEYVADVRSRSEDVAAAVDPQVAERLVREVLGDGSTDDVDGRTSSSTKMYLLAALMVDARLDSTSMDEFIAKVRKMADHLITAA